MIHLIKRKEASLSYRIKTRVVAIIIALLITTLFIIVLKKSPINIFISIFKGAFGSTYRFQETIVKTVLICITSLGVSIAFKMNFANIGAEGQMVMGAIGATYVALNYSSLSMPLLITLMIIAAMITGGLYSSISSVLKVFLNTNETIVTLMLNYIALSLVQFLQYGPWKDPSALGFPKIARFTKNAILPKVLGINIGWIFMIILVIVIYFMMKKSKLGYEISVLGESEKTAKYAGINVKKTLLTTVFISGAICGLAGMISASAVLNTLNTSVSGGVGFIAVMISWLANLNAPIILVTSLLFAMLEQGGAYVEIVFQIPSAVSQLIQAMILFAILGSELFIRYKIVRKKD